jgi:TonB family protein
MKRTRFSFWVFLGLATSLFAAAAPLTAAGVAGTVSAAEAGRSPLDTRRMRQADEQLRERNWAKARPLLQELVDGELRKNRWWSGDLAWSLARLAVAEAGAGSAEEARAHWQIAQNLNGPIPAGELAPYGPPGEQLGKLPRRAAGQAPAELAVRKRQDTPGLKPPRRLPGKALDLGRLVPGSPPLWMRLELIVDATGRVQEPVVLASNSPMLSYEVLSAARDWRYEPAQLDGQPVATFVEVEVGASQELPFQAMVVPEMAAIELLLREGDWKAGRIRAENLWEKALHHSQPEAPALALLLALRALGEAGQERSGPAICHWQAAQSLEPKLFHADLAAYGAAGSLLESQRWKLPEPGKVQTFDRLQAEPEILLFQVPLFPQNQRALGIRGSVLVQTVVDENGAVRLAFPLQGGLGGRPSFAASALDSVCSWKIKPGQGKDGPVPAWLGLTVNFEIRPTDL